MNILSSLKFRSRTAATSAAAWLALAACAGCGDDAVRTTGHRADSGGVDVDDSGVSDADGGGPNDCSYSEDGTACGERGEERHCIAARCVFNTCGDGVRAGAEACDDGNAALGDACDPACRTVPLRCGDAKTQSDEECDDGNLYDLDACSTACTDNICGNGRVDGREECDDENTVDDDACSNKCTQNRCRNGRRDPGEECDDGNRIHDDRCNNACKSVICGDGMLQGGEECDDRNAVDDDACSKRCTANICGNSRTDPGEVCDGDTVASACADDCMGTETDSCRPCEEDKCAFYQSYFDLVAGCFEGRPNAELVPIVDAMFAQHCIDAVDCARRNDCGFDATSSPITSCFCGSADTSTCLNDGPAPDAPCAEQWQAATRTSIASEVLASMSDVSLPSGWAYLMIECDRELCADVCTP